MCRVIKAPGGGSSNIFGGEGKQSNGNGSFSETDSVDGSVFSCPSTPVHNGNGNGSAFGYESDNSSTPSSNSSSRRGSLQETKNRLFGQADQLESPRRRVVDRMKSNIFSEPEPSPVVRTPSVKKYDHGTVSFDSVYTTTNYSLSIWANLKSLDLHGGQYKHKPSSPSPHIQQ